MYNIYLYVTVKNLNLAEREIPIALGQNVIYSTFVRTNLVVTDVVWTELKMMKV